MNPTSPQERVEFLTENYKRINTNCAKALILTEIGFSTRGIAKKLDVTHGTAKKYLDRLETVIGENVTQTVPKDDRYATYPGDTVNPEYSGDYIDIDREFQDVDTDINRGCEIDDISFEEVNASY